MVQTLSLILSASIASSQLLKPTAPNPVNVTVGVSTTVEFALQGPFDCDSQLKPYAGIYLNGTKRGILSHVEKVPDPKTKFQVQKSSKDTTSRALYFALEGASEKFTSNFNYAALRPNTPGRSHVMLSVYCGVYTPEKEEKFRVYVTKASKPFEINAIKGSNLHNQVLLSPGEVRGEEVSKIAFQAPWPGKCRTEKNPRLKLTLNDNSGILASNPSQSYQVKGFVNTKAEEITKVKTNATIKADGFTALEFTKKSYAEHNYAEFDFLFLGQKAINQKVDKATIDVQFFCGGKSVKDYSGKNAPFLKFNGDF